MRRFQIVIFISIAFSILFFANYYVYMQGWKALPQDSLFRSLYFLSFFILTFSFVIGRILERIWHNKFVYFITKLGSFWLAALLYFFIISLFVDIGGLILNLLFPLTNIQSEELNLILLLSSIVFVGLMLIAGYINAIHPRIKKLNLVFHKEVKDPSNFKIVAVSDIHLGSIIGEKRISKMVGMINSLKPDLVCIAGDLLDEDPGSVIQQNLGSCLDKIDSKFGIYAVTGNHEYIGGIKKALPFFEKHGIKVLRDDYVLVDEKIYIVGREDRDSRRFSGIKRKSIKEIMKGVDKSKPIVLMDHQPFHLQETNNSGIDLQISGHTHHGQIWPLQLITKRIFEKSWGYVKKNGVHYYVSSGFGTWGPPVRIGNRPEIVELNIKGRNKS